MNIEQIAQTLGFETEEIFMLLEMFLENANDSMHLLESSIKQNDYEEIKNAAHAIKGSAANLLFEEITQIAGEIEVAAKSKDPMDYTRHFVKLQEALSDLEALKVEA
ncbi:MAG: Hpt domain-containing protein [Epsilonproteobacteria bacterium]|nr:Hpt domain-containing protein [Campylobacterota bacterium]